MSMKKLKRQCFFGIYFQPMSMKEHEKAETLKLLISPFLEAHSCCNCNPDTVPPTRNITSKKAFVKLEYRLGGVQKGYFCRRKTSKKWQKNCLKLPLGGWGVKYIRSKRPLKGYF